METDPGPAKGRFSILSKTFSLPAVVYKEFLEAPERNPTLRPTGSFMGFGFFPFPAAFCPVVLIGVRPLEFMGYRDLGSQPLELSPSHPKFQGGLLSQGFATSQKSRESRPESGQSQQEKVWFGLAAPGAARGDFHLFPGKIGIIGPCLCRCAGISGKIPWGAKEKWEWREWEGEWGHPE